MDKEYCLGGKVFTAFISLLIIGAMILVGIMAWDGAREEGEDRNLRQEMWAAERQMTEELQERAFQFMKRFSPEELLELHNGRFFMSGEEEYQKAVAGKEDVYTDFDILNYEFFMTHEAKDSKKPYYVGIPMKKGAGVLWGMKTFLRKGNNVYKVNDFARLFSSERSVLRNFLTWEDINSCSRELIWHCESEDEQK